VICDRLMLNSVDKRWMKPGVEKTELKGYPYAGYSPISGEEVMVLRVEAPTHLLSIVQKAEGPWRALLSDEFILRDDFKRWLVTAKQPFPVFWFSEVGD
jgi:hypothetical protein